MGIAVLVLGHHFYQWILMDLPIDSDLNKVYRKKYSCCAISGSVC